MKKLLLIVLLVFTTTFTTVHTVVQNNYKDKKKELHIILVHSYNVNHICGTPQQIGFLRALEDVAKDKYNIKIETFYLNGKNKTDIELEILGREAAKKIQVKNPDIIVSFDDIAVEYVLSKQLLEEYPKFSSGLNKMVNEYISEGYKLTNFCGIIEEEVNFSKLKQLIKTNSLLKNKKINVLVDASQVSKQLLRDFSKTFKDNEYQLFQISSLGDLDAFFKKADYKKDVVVNLLQIIEDGNNFYLKDKIIQYISALHSKFIQITTNKSSIEFGADIVVGIDFELMGYMLYDSLKEFLDNGTCKGEIIKATNNLYVNHKSIQVGKFDFSKQESMLFSIVR